MDTLECVTWLFRCHWH